MLNYQNKQTNKQKAAAQFQIQSYKTENNLWSDSMCHY